MIPGEGSRQMENATVTKTPRDWRETWRDFTDLKGQQAKDIRNKVAQAVRYTQDGTFRGFGSPLGWGRF